MRSRGLVPFLISATAALALSACGASDADQSDSASAAGSSENYPVVIEHALGTTTIEEQPERVATVA